MYDILQTSLSVILKSMAILTILIQCQTKKKNGVEKSKSYESNPIVYDSKENVKPSAETPKGLPLGRKRSRRRMDREMNEKYMCEISKMLSDNERQKKKKVPKDVLNLDSTQPTLTEHEETIRKSSKMSREGSQEAESDPTKKEKVDNVNLSTVEEMGDIELVAKKKMKDETRREIAKKATEMARKRQLEEQKRVSVSSPDDTMKGVTSIRPESAEKDEHYEKLQNS